MDPYVSLAQKNIEHYVRTGRMISLPLDLPEEMLHQRAGVFVSIHRKDHHLRGCIGTILPARKNIAEEIIHNSIAACSEDPRFSPVQEQELNNLVINVDVLTKPVLVKNKKELDPKRYGVIVSTTDGRSGLLLPDLDGVDTVEDQVSIAAQKGGIDPVNEEIILHKFEVIRHT
jgi:AmmeMemoRadiSam system protein A